GSGRSIDGGWRVERRVEEVGITGDAVGGAGPQRLEAGRGEDVGAPRHGHAPHDPRSVRNWLPIRPPGRSNREPERGRVAPAMRSGRRRRRNTERLFVGTDFACGAYWTLRRGKV